MRVVAGVAGGIPLHVPGTELRPSMDLVRGAIFSSLAGFVEGARVLDLFAGTGALGIEALSRGALGATFVESDPRALRSLERNLTNTRLTGVIHQMDVFRFLDRFAAPSSFDLILADPPYAKSPGERDFTPELLACASLQRALAPGGVFALEHLPRAPLQLGTVWECFRRKRYGATEVSFLRPPSPS